MKRKGNSSGRDGKALRCARHLGAELLRPGRCRAAQPITEIMKRIAAISKDFNLRIANVFHAGDGNLHPNLLFDMRTPGELDRVIEAGAAIVKACIELGGSITGEHGLGLEKRPTLDFCSTKRI